MTLRPTEEQIINNINSYITILSKIEPTIGDIQAELVLRKSTMPKFLSPQRENVLKLTRLAIAEQENGVIRSLIDTLKLFISEYEAWAEDKEGYNKQKRIANDKVQNQNGG